MQRLNKINTNTRDSHYNIPALQNIQNIGYSNNRLQQVNSQLSQSTQSKPLNEVEKQFGLGSMRIDDELVAVPMTLDNKDDVEFMGKLFTNPNVMKTSGISRGNPLDGQILVDNIQKSIARKTLKDVLSPYGMYKIYDTKIDQYIGTQSVIDSKYITPYNNKQKIVISLTFLDEPYLKKGYGSKLIDSFFSNAKQRGESIMYTVKGDNYGTKKICSKHLPIHLGYIDGVDIFTTDYTLANHKEFCQHLVNEIMGVNKSLISKQLSASL